MKLVQLGEVCLCGIELSVIGKVMLNLLVVVFYVYQDVKVIQVNDVLLNNWLVDILWLCQMVLLWIDWIWYMGLFVGFGFGGGICYQSVLVGVVDNLLMVLSVMLFDVGVYYDMCNWCFVVNGMNLFNCYYISGCQLMNVCIFGIDCIVIVIVKYNW